MGKLICFRVDDDQKARIEAAAFFLNKSVTTFVKENVMSAVENVESRSDKQPKQASLFDMDRSATPEEVESPPAKQTKRRATVPAWFRALCREAAKGGSFGFHRVGYRWASNMPNPPPGFAPAEWQEEVASLQGKLDMAWLFTDKKRRTAIAELILAWFVRNFPQFMELIPPRRRGEFVLGFLDDFDDRMKMRGE
jgi:uncharacterized protein (DUF1778 family)